jgi:hypothetical protein
MPGGAPIPGGAPMPSGGRDVPGKPPYPGGLPYGGAEKQQSVSSVTRTGVLSSVRLDVNLPP